MNQSAPGIPAHWWGKIIGAILGLMRGGLTGLLFGALVGHMVDRFLWGLRSKSQTREVFFRTLFACLGHINKADGRVTEAEIRSARELMRRLQLTETERQEAIAWFNQGKQADFDLASELKVFARHAAMRPDLRQIFVEILLDGAAADSDISHAEHAVLLQVCVALHIPAEMFAAMLSAHRAGSSYHSQAGAGRIQPSLPQAYATLGITESASAAEIKKAYRRLIGQYHPDKLVSRGLPEEMMEKAKARVREINAAYDQVKLARGIK